MYRVNIIRTFESAHFLRNYKGKCENIHGHNYRVEVTGVCEYLGDDGLSVDFTVLHAETDRVLKTIDHTLLNDHPHFKTHNPSSECIARFLYDEIAPMLPETLLLEKVRVWENDVQWAEYLPQH